MKTISIDFEHNLIEIGSYYLDLDEFCPLCGQKLDLEEKCIMLRGYLDRKTPKRVFMHMKCAQTFSELITEFIAKSTAEKI